MSLTDFEMLIKYEQHPLVLMVTIFVNAEASPYNKGMVKSMKSSHQIPAKVQYLKIIFTTYKKMKKHRALVQHLQS